MHSPIVITGMGLVSPLGCSVEGVWRRLLAGSSGINRIEHFDVENFPIQLAGMVPNLERDPELGLDEQAVISPKERKKLDRFSVYALAAAQEALLQAGWRPETDAEQRASATIVGTGIGGFPVITEAQKTLQSRGHKRLSPFTVPAFLANLAAGNLSIRYGFKGPMGCPVTACAAGLQAIGGRRWRRRSDLQRHGGYRG